MKIMMLETREAAPDGIHVVTLQEGDEVDVPDDLAGRYIERGIAAPVETKDLGAAPENRGSPAAATTRGRRRAPRPRGGGKG